MSADRVKKFVERMSEVRGEAFDEPPLLTMDGYDDCIIGVAQRFNEWFVVYDREKILKKLERDGMSEDEALEFHEFNQAGGWHGSATPAFLDTPVEGADYSDETDPDDDAADEGEIT